MISRTHSLDRALDGTLDNKYYSEQKRLETFTSWPLWSPIPPSMLAKEGFVYDDNNSFYLDQVFCVFCKTSFHCWHPCENPQEAHQKRAPNCPFVLKSQTQNISIHDDFLRQQIQYQFLGSTKPVWYEKHLYQHGFMKQFTTHQISTPIHQHFANKITRLASFGNRKSILGSPLLDHICDDGFFSSASGEKIVCFYCNLVISSLAHNEDVFVRHRQDSPHCHWALYGKIPPKEQHKQIDFFTSKYISFLENKLQHHQNLNNKLKEEKLCKICWNNEFDTVFNPCGHTTCSTCLTKLHHICCVCRTQIKNPIKIRH